MITISYTKINSTYPNSLLHPYLDYLPERERTKVLRFVRWQDMQASLLGKIMLLKSLQELGYSQDILKELEFTSYGRPYLTNGVEFNISHSGEFVVCALGTSCKIGVDIEQIKEIDFSDFHNFFTAEEYHTIEQANDPTAAFYHYWCTKEAIIKVDGRGLSFPVLEIKILGDKAEIDGSTYFLKKLNLVDGYVTYLATDLQAPKIQIKRFEINNTTFIF